MTILTLVQQEQDLYQPDTEADRTILMHITSGLCAVNAYGLESLVYPIANLHGIAVNIRLLPPIINQSEAELGSESE